MHVRVPHEDAAARTRDGRGMPSPAVRGPRSLLSLQGSVGNRAVAAMVAIQRAGSTPQPYRPTEPLPDPVVLGDTVPGGSGSEPTFTVDARPSAGGAGAGRRGRPRHTDKGTGGAVARYVEPGVYPRTPASNGAHRAILIEPALASLVKAGEQEHSDDIWWTHELVFGPVAEAVNRIADDPDRWPDHTAPDIRALHLYWHHALHGVMSPKLRVEGAASMPPGGSVSDPWRAAVQALLRLTYERDRSHWHDMNRRPATPAERTEHAIAPGTYLEVAIPGGAIGRHPSEPMMRAAFAGLPDLP